MIDTHDLERFQDCMDALKRRHAPTDGNAWTLSPWAWVRDMSDSEVAALTRDLLPMLLGAASMACSLMEEAGGSFHVGIGARAAREVRVLSSVEIQGGVMHFSPVPLSKECQAVCLLGYAPVEPMLWVVTRTAWDAQGGNGRLLFPTDLAQDILPWLPHGRLEHGLDRLMRCALGTL